MSAYGYQTKTNVAPLIDVSLIIVLALMVMAPHLKPTSNGVDLPEANASEVSSNARVEITCTLSGDVIFEDQKVTLPQLRERLAAYFKENPQAIAVIKADRGMSYGDVKHVVEEAEAAQAPRVAIATREREFALGETNP